MGSCGETEMTLERIVIDLSKRAKAASVEMLTLSTETKNGILLTLAELLQQKKKFIQQENEKDLAAGRAKGLNDAMLDRLHLTDEVVNSMVVALNELVMLDDPVGRVEGMKTRPNGLQTGRMRIPIGVIAMIYESRPNVTVDAAALCLKAGNCIILRGGSEAIHSNLALSSLLQEALAAHYVNPDVVQLIPVTDREAVTYLLEREDEIDLVIPRGGEGLIRTVVARSRIPVLKHYKGVCHIYVDKDADLAKACDVIVNSKTHRTGVCNALEGVLIHRNVAEGFVPALMTHLTEKNVEVKGCLEATALDSRITPAGDNDWGTEFLGLAMCMKIVSGFEEAQAYIGRYGSRHTESIITENYTTARRFIQSIDASAVMVNASTRFNDGGQLGLGAEIGISTTKLHAYGPMGLEELTTRKFVVYGEGHVRV